MLHISYTTLGMDICRAIEDVLSLKVYTNFPPIEIPKLLRILESGGFTNNNWQPVGFMFRTSNMPIKALLPIITSLQLRCNKRH